MARGALHNLPAQPTPLLGRVEEIAGLQQALVDRLVRLVTLTGPGGIGKSRLAVEAAAATADAFVDGVVFVDLVPVREASLVPEVIGRALRPSETAQTSGIASVAEAVQDRRMLFVLDNFEQVLAAAPGVAEVVATCPHLTVLVTSRAPLRLRWELEVPIGALATPETDVFAGDLSTLASSPAVTLFVQRARAVRSDFVLDAQNARDVASICARVQGVPLAIELHKDLQGSTNVATDPLGNTFQHQEYFPGGEVWITENSTVFRTPWQYQGGYVDEVRAMDDFGDRWYDPVREMMYSPDPVLTDDPTAIVGTPSLRTAYSFAGSNPVANVDPTGREFTPAQRKAFIKANFTRARELLANDPALRATVAANLSTRLPDSFVRMGLDIATAQSRQKKFEMLDDIAKPFVEINVSTGEVELSPGLFKQFTVREGTSASSNTAGSAVHTPAMDATNGIGTANATSDSGTNPHKPLPTPPSGGQAPSGASARPPQPLPPTPVAKQGGGTEMKGDT